MGEEGGVNVGMKKVYIPFNVEFIRKAVTLRNIQPYRR